MSHPSKRTKPSELVQPVLSGGMVSAMWFLCLFDRSGGGPHDRHFDYPDWSTW